MIFYDFEVFKYDWLVVFIDTDKKEKIVVVNDKDKLTKLYEENKRNIWVGYNNKHYDQYIFKGIMLGMNPKVINDKIIVEEKEGWQISREFSKIPMINYDVFASKSYGLKTLEGFMGNNIKETDVPFNIDRKLTAQEIEQTVEYCTSDVENTINVFMERIDTFNAFFGIVKAFPDQCTIANLGDTSAQITANVLGCEKHEWTDEFDFFFLPCLRLKKYKYVQDWFEKLIGNKDNLSSAKYYKQSFPTIVAGIPHVFGFGGLHGAPGEIITKKNGDVEVIPTSMHYKGAIYHVDVNNYYPSMLLAYDLVTRSATNNNFHVIYDTRKQLKYKQTHAKDKAEAKHYKKAQMPYKLVLNALSGAMKDKGNKAYDPRNNNIMCINGQLMLLDLIEHLEVIPEFRLIQSNTDGLIVQIPDTDEAFEMLDDICYEWESRCSTDLCDIKLETDQIGEIYQKDVNNYLWIDLDGGIERKGAYVKELNTLDYDLPIINEALVEFMAHKVPVEKTINSCNDLIKFQKIVKLSSKYDCVEHNGIRYDYKCYRVFASKNEHDGQILKCRVGNNPAKFGNTPDRCFIDNDDINGKAVPDELDRTWYIELAKHRLEQFGVL